MPPPDLDALLSRTNFPGMIPLESRLAREWLRRHAAEYDAIEFNVRLGAGLQLGEEFSDATRRLAVLATQKRADIVARRGNDVTIVEVKERLGLSALGQLIGYRTLWMDAHDGDVVRLVAIAQSAGPDVEGVLLNNGIAVELFSVA